MTASTFQPGTVYSTRSICNYDCVFSYRIIRRTDKSVWVCPVRNGEDVTDETKRRSIMKYDGQPERIYPQGQFSMAPSLTADDKR
jgi:hypothetical protein